MEPSETLYVRNINEKLPKTVVQEELQGLVKNAGIVLAVIAKKTLKMKGQAFVVMKTKAQSAKALAALQGIEFHGKPLVVDYAKSKSDVILAKTKAGARQVEQRKAEREKAKQERISQEQQQKQALKNKRAASSENDTTTVKRAKTSKVREETTPNRVLLLQQLPDGTTQDDLVQIYGKYPGFEEVRLVAVRRVAFIEFGNESDAIAAHNTTKGISIKGAMISVSYAKR